MSDLETTKIVNKNGRTLYVLESDFIMKRNLRESHFQALNLRFVRSRIKHGRRCIDAGASLGMNSVEYADFFDEVEAFEPDPIGYQLLEKTLAANHVQNVNPYNAALGDRSGTMKMNCYERKTGLSSFVIKESGSMEVDVDMTTIDAFGYNDVDFIKIDVEGFELQVLEGARNTIIECGSVLQVEVNHAEEPQDIIDCVLNINPSYRSFINTGGYEGDKYRHLKGKIDRFFLLPSHGKRGMIY